MQVDRFFSSAIFLAAWLGTVSALRAEPLLRLYDMSPVSATNPAVASVKECGIEIPLNEFRAYVNLWIPPEKKLNPLTKADKLRYLQQLLDDHFLVWDGYQKKLDGTAELTDQLDYTLRLNLEEALVRRELEEKAPKTGDDKEKVIDALEDRVFKDAGVQVVKDAYEELKSIVNTPDGTEPDLQQLTDLQRNRVLVRYAGGTLSTGDCLENYYGLPTGSRPDILDTEDFLKLIRSIVISPLMQAAARKEGLAEAPWVQSNVQLNRNVLTKMAMLEWLAKQGRAQRGTEAWNNRVKQWYQAHKSRYTTRDARGNESFLPFESNKENIMDDYEKDVVVQLRTEEIRSLRQQHTIVINDHVLERLSFVTNPTENQRHENADKTPPKSKS